MIGTGNDQQVLFPCAFASQDLARAAVLALRPPGRMRCGQARGPPGVAVPLRSPSEIP